jgi:hypothetical protein
MVVMTFADEADVKERVGLFRQLLASVGPAAPKVFLVRGPNWLVNVSSADWPVREGMCNTLGGKLIVVWG